MSLTRRSIQLLPLHSTQEKLVFYFPYSIQQKSSLQSLLNTLHSHINTLQTLYTYLVTLNNTQTNTSNAYAQSLQLITTETADTTLLRLAEFNKRIVTSINHLQNTCSELVKTLKVLLKQVKSTTKTIKTEIEELTYEISKSRLNTLQWLDRMEECKVKGKGDIWLVHKTLVAQVNSNASKENEYQLNIINVMNRVNELEIRIREESSRIGLEWEKGVVGMCEGILQECAKTRVASEDKCTKTIAAVWSGERKQSDIPVPGIEACVVKQGNIILTRHITTTE